MAFIWDGFSTIIAVSLNPAILFREKEVQPGALDSGGPIDTTTMRNVTLRTQGPKSLVTIGEMVCQVNYDPAVRGQIFAMLGLNQTITITYPDGSVEAFRGVIDKFTPASLREGEFPLAELRIFATNRLANGAEQAPAGAGFVGAMGAGGLNPGVLAF